MLKITKTSKRTEKCNVSKRTDSITTYSTTGSVQLAGDSIWGYACLLYTSPSPRDRTRSRMPSSA